MTTEKQAAVEKMIFRKTNAHTGRHVSITPSNSRMRHLAYGRIRLDFWNGRPDSIDVLLKARRRISPADKVR